ncbi:N-6 DNA methylase [Clostridium perfringens]|uniref:N-6 DNA methylase n=1 Tax=Clostridium perfringens TaxID=1502 RepID=UPI0024BC92B9|nr:N-6 DNA methylase [Clostridium perfringens]MDK0537451.1 N-6 DNA methylase [Clostridium perfringens]MDM0454007.1 N-6 DNA methylase [Clostridium perfringens]
MSVNIKAIQDIMRKDVGVDGDAQRISQLVWMMFLKILDDQEYENELIGEYSSPIPEEYRWRNWAANDEGKTGDDLVDFINNKLFPNLRALDTQNNNGLAIKIRTLFEDTYNYMKSGTLIRQVINKINEVDFNNSEDRHIFNFIYEEMLKELQNAGNSGEFYTPRAVTQFMVEMVSPKVGDKILDPACGTGGFLICALEYLREQIKSIEDNHTMQNNLMGIEKKPLPYMLAITNMLLHGVNIPNIKRDNTLGQKPLKDYDEDDEVDIVITNPPFGGKEEKGIPANFPKIFKTNETADLFLVYIMKILSEKGRAAIVLPDGSLFGKSTIKTRIKKKLLEEFNLHTIVRLPKDVFSPYTDIATNILFFEKGKKTEKVWYYEHQMPENMKHYSKTKPIKYEEFEAEKAWWNSRVESENAWQVSIEEIISNNYDLDFSNPRKKNKGLNSPEEIIELVKEHQKVIDSTASDLLNRLEKLNINKDIEKIKLNELMKKSTEQIELEPNNTYQQVTVKLWGKGVIERNKVKGATIASKKRNVVRENQLIFSKIDARNGAIGIVPDYLDGAVVSTDFPSFIVDTEKILPEYLEIIVKMPEFVKKCGKISSGTTNRVRLKERDFLDIMIPVPTLDDQEEIISETQSLLELCDSIEHEISKLIVNSNDLKNSLLHNLLKE